MKFKRILHVTAVWAIAAAGIAAQTFDGDWTGKLTIGPGRELKIVIHINERESKIELDSPEQGVRGIATETLLLSADSINFTVPALNLDYSGRRVGDTVKGTFRQGGLTLPLSFDRGEVKARRPQTPVAPFPYSTEEVTIENPAGGSVLAGTLCLPENATSKTPIVVLVTGSSLQNRDEELFEHKPFAVIADYLARHGIGSLRYDDRGFGESTGDAFNATTADFASDTQAVIDWLRKNRNFKRVGIIGHSEGGQIAYMLAARNIPDFIVSIAGPAIKGSKTIAFQNKVALANSGIDSVHAADFADALERTFEYKLQHKEPASITNQMLLMAQLYPQHADDAVTRQLSASIVSLLSAKPDYEWMMYFLAYDPADDMAKINVPALIIYGDNDLQVPPSLNAAPASEAAPGAIVKIYPDLNHMMQHAATGQVAEYAQIEETISPEVLTDIADFILSVR